jgi:hypothetical protein
MVYLDRLLLLLQLLSICNGLLGHFPRLKTNNFFSTPRISTCIQLIAPEVQEGIQTIVSPNGNFVMETAQQATSSFIDGFNSRLIGTIIGNLLAGFAFKLFFDFVILPLKNGFQSSRTAMQQNTELQLPEKPPVIISGQAWLTLILCISLDLIGDSSYLLPGVGEAEDIAWAPISALILRSLFGSNIIAALEFTKEILPFTDILPLATTVWLLQNVFPDSALTELLQLKQKAESAVKKKEDIE